MTSIDVPPLETSRIGSVRASIVIVLALPFVAATLIVLTFAVAETFGDTPFSYPAPRNVAEAAGMGSGSEVMRFLRQGHDPTQVQDVRPEIISSAITRVTAFEAAIWSRRIQLLRLLDRHVPIAGDDMRRDLACLASDLRTQDILEYLATAASAGCEPGQTIRGIEKRSR